MSGDELRYIEDAFRSNWIAPLGPHVDAFEKETAQYAGVNYSLATSSGSAALKGKCFWKSFIQSSVVFFVST